MSQYQPGSYVQFSRNDKGVIEIRMNPSIYPIAIANWNWIKEVLLPEINRAYFHVTINRPGQDFTWGNDRILLDSLRALGMLDYAGEYSDVKEATREDISFGQVYLGQTVRLDDRGFLLSGNWGGEEGEHGQLSVYSGFGKTFDALAYYLSMALMKPEILRPVREGLVRSKTLYEALRFEPEKIRAIFSAIQAQIEDDEKLWYAFNAGNRIIQLLNPGQ